MQVKCKRQEWESYLTSLYGQLEKFKLDWTILYYSKEIKEQCFGLPKHVGSWESGLGWDFEF